MGKSLSAHGKIFSAGYLDAVLSARELLSEELEHWSLAADIERTPGRADELKISFLRESGAIPEWMEAVSFLRAVESVNNASITMENTTQGIQGLLSNTWVKAVSNETDFMVISMKLSRWMRSMPRTPQSGMPVGSSMTFAELFEILTMSDADRAIRLHRTMSDAYIEWRDPSDILPDSEDAKVDGLLELLRRRCSSISLKISDGWVIPTETIVISSAELDWSGDIRLSDAYDLLLLSDVEKLMFFRNRLRSSE